MNPDNETIIIPNGAVVGGNIKNYSKEGKIRHNLAMGISYDSNIKEAREVLMKAMSDHELVLQDPAPSVIVSELGDAQIDALVNNAGFGAFGLFHEVDWNRQSQMLNLHVLTTNFN